ncbi:sterol desaturase family protein [Caulobacter soli]|uniref:sterol desaturase family protein n=1 Tax=Caulobacter soli TaxID=2708539 RepID=UPI0013EDA272|nr:sterol desaturase family protein [Caulobacter soli]
MAIRRLLHPVALSVIGAHLALVALGWWALLHVVPDTLTLHVFGREHIVSEVHRRVIDRTVELSVLLPIIFLLEYLWTGWEESSLRHLLVERTASGWSDVACYLFQLAPAWTLVTAVMSFGVVYISGEWLRGLLAQATGIDLTIAGAPLPFQVVLLFLLYTFFDYWSHRLDHSRVFWPLHRFHHAAESFSILTAARVHPAVFTAVVGAVLPGVLLGCDREALAEVGLAIIIIRLVVHSRVESNFGWIGRWIVQSPLHHRLHHSLNRMPINLSLLPLWDRLFGTWRDAPQVAMRIGTPAYYRHGAWIVPDLWRDYCEFGAGLRKLVIDRSRRLNVVLRPRRSTP